MHYDTWPHTWDCCLLRSRIRRQSSQAAPPQGPASLVLCLQRHRRWGHPGAGCHAGRAQPGSSPGVSQLWHFSARGESCTCFSFSVLSPTTGPSSKCFPSLLLKLLRHTTSFCEEIDKSISCRWRQVIAPWFLYWEKQWADNSQLHLSYSVHDSKDICSSTLRSSLFQSQETHPISPFLVQKLPCDSDHSWFPCSDLSLSYHTLLEQGDKNSTQYSGCSWTIATDL